MMAGHCYMATIHQEVTEDMRDFNRICPESRAKSSSLGVGQSSGELMSVAHCYNCVANVCASQPSTDSPVFMLGEEENGSCMFAPF